MSLATPSPKNSNNNTWYCSYTHNTYWADIFMTSDAIIALIGS